MTRVLLTTDTLGGVWRYTVELASAWARSGHDVTVATLGPRPSPVQRAELSGPGTPVALVETDLPLDWTATGPSALRGAADALARIARDRGVERVHLHAPALAGDAGWPAPVVAVVHSCLRTWWRAVRGAAPLPPALAWRDAEAERGIRRVDALIAPGCRFAREVAEAYRLPEGRVHPVPNGTGVPDAASGRRTGGAAVLACGRAWDEGKDPSALEAAARLLPPAIPVRFAGALLGPNGERAPFLRRVEALGALDATGLAAVRAASSVFVSTARYEPFGLAVLEAARSGLALVLVDLPSLREHWEGAARFVPQGDPEALAAALAETARAPDALGALATRRAALFTPDRMASATARVHGI